MRDFLVERMLIFMQVTNPTADRIGLPQVTANPATVKNILAVVFGVIAAITIIVIILAALTIVTGGDEPEKISRGKRAILYAFIGLAIALSAEIIVQFVLGEV